MREKATINRKGRTTIDGYYIHDCRKAARFTFEELLICVRRNIQNRCYDILVREKINQNGTEKMLDMEQLRKFRSFYPKSFNVIILTESQADLMTN